MKILKKVVTWSHGEINSFCFLPENKKNLVAIFSHGYTSHKDALLPWAIKLSKIGISCILFDLPGHYLGSFSEVFHFKDFSENIHKIFKQSYDAYVKEIGHAKIIIGGHSLGAFLAIKASEFLDCELVIGVAHGISLPGEQIAWDSSFFKETLEIRKQLVSPALGPSQIFPWIQQEQEKLDIKNKKIVLIGGKDDLIVPEKRLIALKKKLEEKNLVVLKMSERLPHNHPEMASSLIRKTIEELLGNNFNGPSGANPNTLHI